MSNYEIELVEYCDFLEKYNYDGRIYCFCDWSFKEYLQRMSKNKFKEASNSDLLYIDINDFNHELYVKSLQKRDGVIFGGFLFYVYYKTKDEVINRRFIKKTNFDLDNTLHQNKPKPKRLIKK